MSAGSGEFISPAGGFWPIAALLVGCRLGGLCLVAPFFATRLLTLRLRLGVVVTFTALALLSEPVRSSLESSPALRALASDERWSALLLLPVCEFLLGAGLGWLILLVVAAVRGACQLISQQIGFATDTVVDPLGGQADPLLARLYTALAVLALLSLDLHLSLVSCILESFHWVPPGTLKASAVPGVLGQLALHVGPDLMVAAVSLALPVLVVMLLLSLAQGLLGRTLPEAELLVLGLPIRLVVGLGVLALLLPSTADLMRSLFERAFADGQTFLKMMAR